MTNATTEYVWAVIGGGEAGIYRDSYCPRIKCGRGLPALPFAIQCRSQHEGRRVFKTLQKIINTTLPPEPSSDQILAAFSDSSEARTLLEDDDGFYALVIGSPPGIHRTQESSARAQGTFSTIIKRHTTSFWEALAFILVKGIETRMPPILSSVDLFSAESSDTEGDALVESVRALDMNTDEGLPNRLPITSSRMRHSTSSNHSIASESPPIINSLSSPSSPSSLSTSNTQTRRPSGQATSAPPCGPIVYTHVRNLRGIISSEYIPSTESHQKTFTRARPVLGKIAAHYLAAHGYGALDVDAIIRHYRSSTTEEHFVTRLAGEGMILTEARFLLSSITGRWH